MNSSLITNDYLENIIQITDEELITQKNNEAVYFQFHTVGTIIYGCIFTKKSKYTYLCKLCRRSYDKNRKKNTDAKKPRVPNPIINEDSSSSTDFFGFPETSPAGIPEVSPVVDSDTPACVKIVDGQITWLRREHLKECRLITLGQAVAKTHKNLSVIHMAQNACTSKEAFDTFHRNLTIERKDVVSLEDLVDSYPSFSASKSALNKARKYTTH